MYYINVIYLWEGTRNTTTTTWVHLALGMHPAVLEIRRPGLLLPYALYRVLLMPGKERTLLRVSQTRRLVLDKLGVVLDLA